MVKNPQQDAIVEISSLDTNKWYLIKIYQDTDKLEVTGRKAFIRFNEAKSSAGGNGSCNSFGSTMKLDGNKISFSNIFSTKMYCEQVQAIEDSFFEKLGKITRYEIEGNSLLLFEGDKKTIEFER